MTGHQMVGGVLATKHRSTPLDPRRASPRDPSFITSRTRKRSASRQRNTGRTRLISSMRPAGAVRGAAALEQQAFDPQLPVQDLQRQPQIAFLRSLSRPVRR
jgi:hypothetical protein